jgi:hypothetical protein
MTPINPSKKSFLDLPAELRNLVYEHALVQQEPIELAPLQFAHDYINRTIRPDYLPLSPKAAKFARRHNIPCFTAERYHNWRYNKEIQPSLRLLRVSRQINTEASAIYYGQEFRFTNEMGWHILYEWLKTIGPCNRQFIRHLTVVHPAISEYHDMYLQEEWQRRWVFKPTGALVSPVALDMPPQALNPHEKEDEENIFQWMEENDPTTILLSLRDLKSLRFVLLTADCCLAFGKRALHHSLMDRTKFAPTIRLSCLNLVGHFGGRRFEVKTDFAYDRVQRPNVPPTRHPNTREYLMDKARWFFDEVEKKGWKLEEAFYDNHYTYPTPEIGHCANEEICRFVSMHWPGSCGNWDP